MTHCNKGHFKAKHPPGTTVAPTVAEAVGKQLAKKAMTCQSAHALAGSLGVAPGDIGVAIDLQEGQIQKCQLGLFGYGVDRKAIQPARQVPPDLKAAIEASLVDGRLGCAAAWRIADTAGIARMAVANVCEALKIKINACQLGAF